MTSTTKQTLQFTLADANGAKHTLSMPYALPDLPEEDLLEAMDNFKKLELFAKDGAKLYATEKSIQYVKTETNLITSYK
ncbi:DUF2922 domain-containing protein [Secundilactobacillus malefermentans]|uniref:DUF2922 domain-containing protein n=1 Tax=Secundilactobacillus malefermentans TaxID=176292 RepID=A0A4R5NSC0_9LACO|nr:DUF2922 domain-containing protein [Secundilactobacillus malefermentans]KRM56234.1 hypothetical protein FD44_GL001757 [Secundilactobacillus malefermentans DSM 5705 = KCTC 3548]QEA31742.1 DUF2922 domain-containing protein [Secundilactobacillus malefermentans]TDG79914.1 hypothetical protein C5L31_002133 [Secundilactobacillus malefermentans]